MRSNQAVRWMVESLNELEDRVPARGQEGENIHAAVRAQIDVLNHVILDPDADHDAFAEASFADDNFVLEAAFDAIEWANDEDHGDIRDQWEALV